jgi:hypothetical protein
LDADGQVGDVLALQDKVTKGCAYGPDNRVLGGALIGGGTGALVGGLAGETAGAALAGGLIGAAAGAIMADATRPGWCCYWGHHRRHYVHC